MARDQTASEATRVDVSVVTGGAHRLRARSTDVGDQARPFPPKREASARARRARKKRVTEARFIERIDAASGAGEALFIEGIHGA
jgi:hypothetical protein